MFQANTNLTQLNVVHAWPRLYLSHFPFSCCNFATHFLTPSSLYEWKVAVDWCLISRLQCPHMLQKLGNKGQKWIISMRSFGHHLNWNYAKFDTWRVLTHWMTKKVRPGAWKPDQSHHLPPRDSTIVRGCDVVRQKFLEPTSVMDRISSDWPTVGVGS